MRTFIKRAIYFLLLAGSVLGLDQAVKWRVANDLLLGQSWEPFPGLSNFLLITHSFNTGAAFGIFPWASDIILGIAFITIVAFTYSFFRLPQRARLSRIGVALIVGGALSNVIDRIFIGHVVDYFHIRIVNFSNISNFADHAVTLGVALLLIEQWRFEREEMRERESLIERVEGWMLPFAMGTAVPVNGENSWLQAEAPAEDVMAGESDATQGEWSDYSAAETLSVPYDETSTSDIISN